MPHDSSTEPDTRRLLTDGSVSRGRPAPPAPPAAATAADPADAAAGPDATPPGPAAVNGLDANAMRAELRGKMAWIED